MVPTDTIPTDTSLEEGVPTDTMVPTDTSLDEGATTQPQSYTKPKLDPEMNAFLFFSNLAFYTGSTAVRDVGQEIRRQRFGDKSVRQVLESFTNAGALVEFFRSVNCPLDWVQQYRDELKSVEDILHAADVIALTDGSELELLDRYTMLPFARALIEKTLVDTRKRSLNAFFVLGSSGSGKTFFAIKDAATFGVEKQTKRATVYLKPRSISQTSHEKFDKQPEQYVVWVKTEIEKKFKIEFPRRQLDMHLSLVIDEAGAEDLCGYFVDYENLNKICTALGVVAKSTRLIVCGTGLQTLCLSSTDAVVKFRMEEWNPEAMEIVLEKVIKMPGKDNRKAAASAICEQPTLKALSTNARAAYFLLDAVAKAVKYMRTPIRWNQEIQNQVTNLVNAVVSQFIATNGLSSLEWEDAFSRFRVAASVFRAVEAGMGSKNEPSFLDLPFSKRHLARAMIDLNVDSVHGVTQFSRPSIKRAVIVSPASVIILCALFGIPVQVYTTWQAQELTTALYEFCKRALAIYKPCADACIGIHQRWADKTRCTINELRGKLGPNENHQYEQETENVYRSFSSVLVNSRLVRLGKPVPEPNSSTTITVPWLHKDTVWINGPRAPFADVVAFRTLYQCKHSSTDSEITIELWDELSKCGLLKDQNNDSRGRVTLRALEFLWQSNIDTGADPGVPVESRENKVVNYTSDMFPFNQLNSGPRLEEDVFYVSTSIKTASNHGKKGAKGDADNDEEMIDEEVANDNQAANDVRPSDAVKWMIGMASGEQKELPSLPDDFKVRFIISTNADTIRVMTAPSSGRKRRTPTVLGAKEAMVDTTPLNDFLGSNVLAGVSLAFLLS